MSGHSKNSTLKRSHVSSEKGGSGWQSWSIWTSDTSVPSCVLNQRQHNPETKTPSADTAIKKCFPCNIWMLQCSACSTFWMEIKASCNFKLELEVNVLNGPFWDGHLFMRPRGKKKGHWPPGSKVKQTFCQLKPDRLSLVTKRAKGDEQWLWITGALKGLMKTQGQASQKQINHS